MVSIFIFHGLGGNSHENWFPWLKGELEKKGHKVFIPNFPDSSNPILNTWEVHFDKFREHIASDSIVVGHSLGVPFLLTLLQKIKIKSAFLISGFTGALESDFDQRIKTIANQFFDWKSIKENCKNFTIFHSDDDPYVALDKSLELSTSLSSPTIVLEGGGHLNQSSGYIQFPLLLEKILQKLH